MFVLMVVSFEVVYFCVFMNPRTNRNLTRLGIKREVSCIEYVDLRVRHILAIAFRLARIE